MSNIISRDCGYRLEPWNKCGFLGLHSSWATFSTPNRTLRLLAGEYKQSAGIFLWFLPTWLGNPGYGGTQWQHQQWPPCKPFLKVIIIMVPREVCKMLASLKLCQGARSSRAVGLGKTRTDTDHASCQQRWISACWVVEGLPRPQSESTFWSVPLQLLSCSPPCLTCILSHVLLQEYKTNVYCLVFPLLVFASPSPTTPVNSPSFALCQNIINFPETVSPSVCHPVVHREKKM